jgi:lysophospholipase L1-like esterase
MTRTLTLALLVLALVLVVRAQDDPTATPLPDPLPDGPILFVALGDSLTEGAGDYSDRGGYPGRLMAMVEEERPGSLMLNVGHSGWNSDALINGDQDLPSELEEALTAIEEVGEDQPVVALVWIGSNDLWYLYEYNDLDEEIEQQDLDHYTDNLDIILGSLTEAGATVFVALLDDQVLRPVALAGEAFPGTSADELAMMSEHVVRYNEAIIEKAEEYGAYTVDFYDTTIFTDEATLSDDGNHPNEDGYDVIAEIWFEAVAPLLG